MNSIAKDTRLPRTRTRAVNPPKPRPRAHERMKPPSALLLALEGRAMFEWAAFALAWPLLRKAPRGDGHPVMVLPGLAANDHTTWPLRAFLEHLGYAVHPWDQGLNFGPRDHTVKKLVDRVRGIQKAHGGEPITLVGWSLGG